MLTQSTSAVNTQIYIMLLAHTKCWRKFKLFTFIIIYLNEKQITSNCLQLNTFSKHGQDYEYWVSFFKKKKQTEQCWTTDDNLFLSLHDKFWKRLDCVYMLHVMFFHYNKVYDWQIIFIELEIELMWIEKHILWYILPLKKMPYDI